MNYISLIYSFFNTLIDLARPSIILLWDITVRYGMNPAYAYNQFLKPENGFLKFYNFLFNNIYSTAIVMAMLASTVLLLIYNSLVKPVSISKLFIKFFAAIILLESSYKISIFIIYASSVFYSSIYTLKSNWYTVIFTNVSIKGNLISLLFTGSFMLAIAILFGVLIIRQALMIFFILILPVAAILLILPGGSKIAFKFYRLFFELSFFPFFTIMMLYTISLYSNAFLEIGIIYVAATAPIFLMTELYNYFRSGFNFIDTGTIISTMDMIPFDAGIQNVLNSGKINPVNESSDNSNDFSLQDGGIN